MSGGSPTDNNAILVRAGQEEVMKPYVDSGVVKIVADFWVDNWDAAKALANDGKHPHRTAEQDRCSGCLK